MADRFGLREHELCDAAKLAFYGRQGLTWQRGGRVGVTPAGMPLLDALLGELVPATLVAA
jgi:oxygen-independent coproporphyrinogen-3 oxidase